MATQSTQSPAGLAHTTEDLQSWHGSGTVSQVQNVNDTRHGHVPYTVFTKHERHVIVFLISIAGLFSPFTANIYFPAIPTIADAFDESIEKINLTVTVYMILQGISPSLWGSIADRKGRRPLFLLCLLILLLSCIGLALIPTSAYWALLVLRCVQAAGSASTIALAFGTIADITVVEERGGFVGIANIGPVLGPCIGPVVGGLLADALGWRSIFWFLAIATGACLVCMFLFFPETLRSMVGNGSIPAPRWNRPPIPLIGKTARRDLKTHRHIERPPPIPLPNPFTLFTNPDLLLILAINAIIYSSFYAVNTTISSLFTQHYPFLTETEIGLCFLSVGGGGAVATVTVGRLMDYQFAAVKKKIQCQRESELEEKGLAGRGAINAERNEDGSDTLGGCEDENFPLERACLKSQHVWIWTFVVTCVGYGWALQAGTNIAVPLILQFILGYAMTATLTVTQTLLLDLFPSQGSSVTAANNLVRCLSGAAVVSVVTIITDAIKPGWTYTLFGGVCALTWPLLLWEIRMGPLWRRQRLAKDIQ